jgi:ribosome-associated protein
VVVILEKKEVLITTPFITLGQLLKEESIIGTGGQAKWYLREHTIEVNDEPENRRGKKLYPKDTVNIPDEGLFIVRSRRED